MNDGGVLHSNQSKITLLRSSFDSNFAINDGGVFICDKMLLALQNALLMETNNGGVINAYQGNLYINEDSIFIHNICNNDGGVIHAYQLSMTLTGSRYDYNEANKGGVCFINQGQITVIQSIVSHSNAENDGGVLYLIESNITVSENNFLNNYTMNDGGVIRSHQSNITLSRSFFDSNNATKDGGVIFMSQRSNTVISD